MKIISEQLVGKTIAAVEFDTYERYGFKMERDTAIEALIFTDGSRLTINAVMAGANDSEPFAKITLK